MPQTRVRSAALAKRLGVVPRTITNWVNNANLPVAAEDDGGRWFDPEVCERWWRNNESVRGGKRTGAGRKARRTESGGAIPFDAAQTAADVQTRIQSGLVPDDALHVDDLLHMSRDELAAVVRLYDQLGGAGGSSLSKSSLDRLNAILAARSRQMANDKEAGLLVDANEAAAEFAEALTAARRAIDDLPGRMASAVAADLEAAGLTSAAQSVVASKVRDAIEAECGRVLSALSGES